MSQNDTSKRTPQWVAGNAVESALFGQARECAAKVGRAGHSKILWAGNSAIFLAAAVLATPEGAPLVNASLSLGALAANPFDSLCSILGGYAAMKAIHEWFRQAKFNSELLRSVEQIKTPMMSVLDSAQRAEPKVDRDTIYALAALSVVQAESEGQEAKPAKPRGLK